MINHTPNVHKPRIKKVHRSCDTAQALDRDTARFRDITGTVTDIQKVGSHYEWTGEILVEDMQKDVEGDFHCGRCAGTGQFITYIENNVPKGPGGKCFRCDGKGFHNRADRKRNLYHDTHFIVRGMA